MWLCAAHALKSYGSRIVVWIDWEGHFQLRFGPAEAQGSGGGQAAVERGAERAHVSVSSGSQAFGARGLERARTAEQGWL